MSLGEGFGVGFSGGGGGRVFLWRIRAKGKGAGRVGDGVGTGKGTGKSMRKLCRNYPLAKYPLSGAVRVRFRVRFDNRNASIFNEFFL